MKLDETLQRGQASQSGKNRFLRRSESRQDFRRILVPPKLLASFATQRPRLSQFALAVTFPKFLRLEPISNDLYRKSAAKNIAFGSIAVTGKSLTKKHARRLLTMRHLLAALMTVVLLAGSARAQSTISNRAYELTAGGGLWGALLPAYELGTSSAGGHAYRDSLDDLGGLVQAKAVRRFLWTRTNFEAQGFYAAADSSSTSSSTSVDVPNPISGAVASLVGGRPRLGSDVKHYGGDVGLRDTWQTSFGGLSAGALFSYMAFDQQFDVDYSGSNLFREDLDSEFRGGKAVFGWEGYLYRHATNLDFAIGFYDLNSDYRVATPTTPRQTLAQWQENATTFETSLTTKTCIREVEVGLTLGLMYISDMPRINHRVGTPATIVSDDAVTLTGMIEVLLW